MHQKEKKQMRSFVHNSFFMYFGNFEVKGWIQLGYRKREKGSPTLCYMFGALDQYLNFLSLHSLIPLGLLIHTQYFIK